MSEPIPSTGTLTDRVDLKQRMTSQEDEGGEIALYTPIATVWARVRSLNGWHSQQNDARGVVATHSVVLRFRTGVSPGDRIVYRGRNLEVLSANDLNGRHTYLSCLCTEGTVTG